MRKIKMNTTANLGKAPVRTLVLQLAIPSMTAQFVNVLYSIIDRMYIGHISEMAHWLLQVQAYAVLSLHFSLLLAPW